MYMDYDLSLYDECSSEYMRVEEEKKRKGEESQKRWQVIETLAVSRVRG